jgi:hypothetical protein
VVGAYPSNVLKGIVSREFDGLFMILSYSLDVGQVPMHLLFLNFMFSYLNIIIKVGTVYTVQKEQGVRLVSLMQREIILYMASAMCVSSYLADFYMLSKFASLE